MDVAYYLCVGIQRRFRSGKKSKMSLSMIPVTYPSLRS